MLSAHLQNQVRQVLHLSSVHHVDSCACLRTANSANSMLTACSFHIDRWYSAASAYVAHDAPRADLTRKMLHVQAAASQPGPDLLQVALEQRPLKQCHAISADHAV